MTVEDKVLAKIRRLFIDDTTIAGYIKDRAHASHISSIAEPVFPAISLFRMNSRAWHNAPLVVDMFLQIDFWFQSPDHNPEDVGACHAAARTLLNVQQLTDSNVTFLLIEETDVPGMTSEQETKLYHLPARYRIVAK